MSALTKIMEQLDRIAAGKQASGAAWSGDDFWTLVDGAADETYENRVKGQDLTDIDTELANGPNFSTTVLRKWFIDHHSYFFTDLGLTTDPTLQTYLETYGGWRVPYLAADAHYNAMSSRLATERVFPKGTLVADAADPSGAGMHKFGRFNNGSSPKYSSTDGVLTALIVGAAIVAINLSAAQSTEGVFSCLCQDGVSTKAITVTYNAAAQYTQQVLGAQDMNGSSAAGQKVVPVLATAQFTDGEYVLIWESDALQEVAKIDSIIENTSLTMEDNLINTYTTAAVVWPLFTNIEYTSGGSGSNNVDFFARPDRIISL